MSVVCIFKDIIFSKKVKKCVDIKATLTSTLIIEGDDEMPILKTIFKKLNPLSATNRYMNLMFNATPLGCSLWDENFNIIDCNQESARLFNLSDKSEFKEKFRALSPPYQPCGRPSFETALEYIGKAFKEGSCRFDWTHLSANGKPIPCEIILVRVENRGKPIVAAYKRDLSELNATLRAMRKAEDGLKLALVAAEDNAKAKGEFLNNISHELRTPMNGILGFLRMLSGTDMTGEQRKYLTEAERSAKSLLKIIDTVLDFTEIKDEKMKVDAVQFKLQDVFDEIIEIYEPAAKAKNLELNLRLPPDLPYMIVGDLQKLKKIISSLVDNAVKFTEKGKITLRAKVKNQTDSSVEMMFYVRDTGIGILPEQMKSLFEPFWQADASLTRKHGGTGFGLALSKHLAALLDGKIWVESEYEEGATFYFTARFRLPEQGASEKTHDPGDTHLLVVEDVEINQMIAEEILAGMGYAVDIANNGQEAIDMLAVKDYHAILMDIQMPVLDGLTATTRIRKVDKYKNLPIIAVSAHALHEDKEKSLAHGMNDHITKPIDPDALGTALNKWLKLA